MNTCKGGEGCLVGHVNTTELFLWSKGSKFYGNHTWLPQLGSFGQPGDDNDDDDAGMENVPMFICLAS